MKRSIWIGWEPREADAYAVTCRSLFAKSPECPRIQRIDLANLRSMGLYQRETVRRKGQLYDVISDAPMATQFAISRFFTPILAQSGWALFMDCDMLARADVNNLFDLADPSKAVMCVQHATPVGKHASGIKMDGQQQTAYARKNWSSVMLFNCDHPANRALSIEMLNSARGRDLHQFCWLDAADIGALPHSWNHLVGVDPHDPLASIAHFTLGVPSMKGYADSEFADEWRSYL